MKTDSFAYYVTKYFSDYLPNQTAASTNTIRSYRDTFIQLLSYFKKEKHILPEKLCFSDFTPENVEGFLCWLERERGISAATRNQRLAAVHAFFRYIQYREPAGFEQCVGVLGVPFKKTPSPAVDYMSLEEMQILFSVPDQTAQKGLRDLAIMLTLYETGARVQELIDLQVASFRFGNINQV
ncbi:MAG: site-specific integrase [Lachnospiraceae bacterium]|nr:site-specific integrase [Lachnospiraceae bacterium]